MEQYTVTGMSCAACSARVEKAVNAVEGVTACSVSLLTNSMGVEGTASPSNIIAAVEKAGYGAARKEHGKTTQNSKGKTAEDTLKDTETPKIKRSIADMPNFFCRLYNLFHCFHYCFWLFCCIFQWGICSVHLSPLLWSKIP